tara:strand:+ start:8897 stop:9817 length:921 start_codon:yes stop_codon:yes gene_type:complete
MISNIKINDLINYKKYEVDNLPKGVSISTMCCSAKLGCNVYTDNIQKYMTLDKDDVLTVKVNNDDKRSIIDTKSKEKKKKSTVKKTKQQKFYNQITIVMRINEGDTDNLNDEKKINLKLFKNGSIQMSGCKRIEEVNKVINKLIEKLQEKKMKIKDDEVTEITFIDDPKKININDFKIDMINSNYRVNLQIDRSKFYNLLLKKKISASYEKCIRACVIIKYCPKEENPMEKEISIFVFQKGNIIITGAKSRKHISSAYQYLNKIILEHVEEISKKNEKEEEELLLGLYDEIINENSHKLKLIMNNK